MKNLLLTLIFSAVGAQAALAQSPLLGRWKADDHDGYIEIYKRGSKYYGKILNTPMENGKPKLDKHNPNAALRSKALHGSDILVGFEETDDNEFENGKIYDPRSGKYYDGRIEVNGNVMELRGFIGASLFGKTVKWRRSS